MEEILLLICIIINSRVLPVFWSIWSKTRVTDSPPRYSC